MAITTSNSISVKAAACDPPLGRISVNLVFANVLFTIFEFLYFYHILPPVRGFHRLAVVVSLLHSGGFT